MSSQTQSLPRKIWEHFCATWPLYAAAAVTIGFGYWTYGLALEKLPSADGDSYSRWEQFKSGQPNSMGDTLAGFVGSLTLIWVVASVIQQSMELKAQRKEFAEMVRAQDAQVEALREQATVFKLEQTQRSEDRAELELNAILLSCRRLIEERQETDKFLEWLTNSGKYLRRVASGSLSSYSLYDSATTEDDFVIQLNELVMKQVSPPLSDDGSPRRRGYSALDVLDTQGVEFLRDLLHKALLLQDRLSSAQRYRLKSLRLSSTVSLLDQALADPTALIENPHTAAGEP